MLEGKKIFVVLPAYNAAATVEKVLDIVDTNDIVDQIILVDDGSSDNTAELARARGLHTVCHGDNRGYGANQKTCYREALRLGADVVVMLHPDLQYSPRLVTAMAAMITSGEYDLVLASRIVGKSNAITGGMPIYKYIGNRILTYVENALMNLKMSEYHSGYRSFSRRLLATLPIGQNSDDFIFDNQIIAQAKLYGFKIGEISCPTRYDKTSSSIGCYRAVVYGLGVVMTALAYRLRAWGLMYPSFLPRDVYSPSGVQPSEIQPVEDGPPPASGGCG